MDIIRLAAIISAILVFLVNALLALLLAKVYLKNKSISYLVWSAGLRFFAIAILLELLFAFGVYSDFLARIYLLAIAMPLLAFSIGYLQFISSKKLRQYYYYYSIIVSFLLIYVLYSSNISNIFSNYMIQGIPQLAVLIASLLVALPAAAILFVIAISYYLKKRVKKILAIIPGVILFCLLNIIHINLSVFILYYLELLGIILIWLGFAGFSNIREYD